RPRTRRAPFLASPATVPTGDFGFSARAFTKTPAAAIMEPKDTPHAPKPRRLVSVCSPRAAGRTTSPSNTATAPMPISQLPAREDIGGCLLEKEGALAACQR